MSRSLLLSYLNFTEYMKAEWRMGIYLGHELNNESAFAECQDMTVKGLNIEQSGGDGLFVDNCERVHISGVNSDGNYRQVRCCLLPAAWLRSARPISILVLLFCLLGAIDHRREAHVGRAQ